MSGFGRVVIFGRFVTSYLLSEVKSCGLLCREQIKIQRLHNSLGFLQCFPAMNAKTQLTQQAHSVYKLEA